MSLTDPKAWDRSLWNLYGAQSLSGETVTEYSSLTYSAIWNAVELIAGTIAALPLDLMQRRPGANRKAEDYKLFHVMHGRWNEYMSAKQGRHVQIAHVLTWGNGYAEIVRDGYGNVIALWPIPPHRVTPRMQDGALVYEIRLEQGQTVILPRAKVLHLLGPSYDGFVGYSRIAMARKSIGLGMAQETFGARYFGAGTHPGLVVSHPQALSPEASTNLRESLNAVYSGLSNSHRLMLLEEGMKVERIGFPPKDSQFLEGRQFSIQEICRWYNVPPHKLKDLTRSSFSNIESEQASFYSETILPTLVDIEQSYDMQLLTDTDRDLSGRGRLYLKHNVKGLLRADTTARAQFYQVMLDRGVFSINDVRELEDMEPVQGGDVHLVPLNMTTLENAGKAQEPEPRRPATLPADEDEDEPANGNGNGVPARRGTR